MSRDATEHEMIERLIDGTRIAADRIQDMCRALAASLPVSPRVLIGLRHQLRQASGSAHQLGHAQANPAFFDLRDQLDAVATNAPALAMSRSPQAGLALAMLGTVLDRLWREARRMVTARSVPRQDVLGILDMRQRVVH